MIIAKKKPVEKYELLAVRVNTFEVDIGSSVNYDAKDSRYANDDTKVYSFNTRVVIEGSVSYPDNRIGQEYKIEVHGGDWYYQKHDLILKDCRVCDEHGVPSFKKYKDRFEPIYDVPKGIGHLDRIRGTNGWYGWIWVPPHVVTHMLSVLPLERPKYLSIYEHIIGRHHFIDSLSVQTIDPAAE